ncbi:MAG: hypothetical protein VW378_07775 [bacterium]
MKDIKKLNIQEINPEVLIDYFKAADKLGGFFIPKQQQIHLQDTSITLELRSN